MIMMIVSVAGIGLQQKIRKIYYYDNNQSSCLSSFSKKQDFLSKFDSRGSQSYSGYRQQELELKMLLKELSLKVCGETVGQYKGVPNRW
jgi:hypothetical protein